MGRRSNNSVSQYALIACLVVALLLGQVFNLHMHILHDGSPLSASAGHIADVHVAFLPHDTTYDSHHQDDAQDHHHPAEIDVSATSIVKKAGLLNPFVFLFFIISIILCVPQLHRIHRNYNSRTERFPGYYLLHPPLRAPPL